MAVFAHAMDTAGGKEARSYLPEHIQTDLGVPVEFAVQQHLLRGAEGWDKTNRKRERETEREQKTNVFS